MIRSLTRSAGLCLSVGAALAHGTAAALPGSCQVHSAPVMPPVIELYTSEGCSSCPPADRWLSAVPDASPTVALAFHVDYWDRLGWKDRHARAEYSQRQAEQQRSSGARFSYTPQVVLDGIDRPQWPAASEWEHPSGRTPSPVTVQLSQRELHLQAQVSAGANAPARLSAYWAVTEQGHVSEVRAGENAGATLHHDHVVTVYRSVPAWRPAVAGTPATLEFDLSTAPDPAHARRVHLVIVDADTGRPVQAVKLGC